jgi:hypothetical protein
MLAIEPGFRVVPVTDSGSIKEGSKLRQEVHSAATKTPALRRGLEVNSD